jgi:hypothetical protein
MIIINTTLYSPILDQVVLIAIAAHGGRWCGAWRVVVGFWGVSLGVAMPARSPAMGKNE